MGLFYYLPGTQIATTELLRGSGLAHLAEGPFEHRGVSRGPDSGIGCVVGRCAGHELGYFADEQTWTDLGGHWIGWPTAARPGPDDFARPRLLPGHWVTLGDGRQWLAPVAVVIDRSGPSPQAGCGLPWVSVREAGGWARRCQPRYRPLLELGLTIMQRVSQPDGEGRVILATDNAEDEAVQALAGNYQIGAAEASALGLLTDDAVANILLALIDGPSWTAEKKTVRAGGHTVPGGAD